MALFKIWGKIRKTILDESALEMFWFINQKRACGGKTALLPLIKSILSKKTKKLPMSKINDKCQQDCKTVKDVFAISASRITSSRIIDL